MGDDARAIVRITTAATAISWIPSESVTGAVFKVPFEVGIAHYDAPPPDVLPDIDSYLAGDQARFVNRLQAWVEVEDGKIVDFGQDGAGRIGSTTLRLGRRALTFLAFALPDLQRATRISPTAVRFEQTAGGRTGVPAPRRVEHAPYAQFVAPLAWSTLAVTVHADGTVQPGLAGASPFPRHWLYDHEGALVAKSATMDYHRWSTSAFGVHSPWGDADSPALVAAVETALEREMSVRIMRAGARPELRRLAAGQNLMRQHDPGRDLYLLLDGMLRVEVDGAAVAELGPGAVVGERAILESGRRTASLIAITPCVVAVAGPGAVDTEALSVLAAGHHREDERRT